MVQTCWSEGLYREEPKDDSESFGWHQKKEQGDVFLFRILFTFFVLLLFEPECLRMIYSYTFLLLRVQM